MERLYTIGFTKKRAEEFFGLLEKNNVKTVVDIRLNNNSQLAGFAKARDLIYFLETISGIDYCYMPEFAPTKEILNSYRKKELDWKGYEKNFNALLEERVRDGEYDSFLNKSMEGICLLCSEKEADYCHRRLVADFIRKTINDRDIEIIHI